MAKKKQKHNPLLPKRKRGRPKKEETIRGERITNPDEEAPRKPRQKRLPTMEDPQIEELESIAEKYADMRDQRVQLTAQEVPLKEKLLTLMKSNNKTSYHHDGFDIKVVAEKETVRVKIKREEKDGD